MKSTILIFIIALAMISCAMQKNTQNQSQTISETSDDRNQLQGAPNSFDQELPKYKVHIVQNGELLSVIAERYGVSVKDLVSINNITDPDLTVIGQELLISKPEGKL